MGRRRRDEERFTTCWPLWSNSQRYEHRSVSQGVDRISSHARTGWSVEASAVLTGCTVESGPLLLAVTASRKAERATRSSSVRHQCVPVGLLILKDATWKIRACSLIPTCRRLFLRAQPPQNQWSTPLSLTGPTRTLLAVPSAPRERPDGGAAVRPSRADRSGRHTGRRHRRGMVAALGLGGGRTAGADRGLAPTSRRNH